MRRMTLTEEMIQKCSDHVNDQSNAGPCASGAAAVHCYFGKVKFDFKG